MMQPVENSRIGILGLGYVGLPLAIEFGKQFDTVGFDINADRVRALIDGKDSTNEMTAAENKAGRSFALHPCHAGFAKPAMSTSSPCPRR